MVGFAPGGGDGAVGEGAALVAGGEGEALGGGEEPGFAAEVEDFVDFIANREEAQGLTRAAAAGSAAAFAAVWNNPEDDIYNDR